MSRSYSAMVRSEENLPAAPLVSIFGAKAAPAYTIAKDIIHALLTLSKVIAADRERRCGETPGVRSAIRDLMPGTNWKGKQNK